ncbi:hypothetical protein EV126DRAFT_414209 [Verticillium dahliae]|nr:hypothetical protein EV126DRAFT_414209 [Verticillium dahliae]
MEQVLPRSRLGSSLASRWPRRWRRKRGVTGVFCAAARRREARKRARMVLTTVPAYLLYQTALLLRRL